MSNDSPTITTDADLQAALEGTDKLVILDFMASWCAPCKQLAPILDDIGDEFAQEVAIYKIDVDQNAESATRMGVRGLPTLVFLKENAELDRLVGTITKTRLAAKVDDFLA